jgi:o-succinylbenzoate synthase
MALKIDYQPYILKFRFEAGTSRGVMTQKTSWILKITDSERPHIIGEGECGPLPGLSLDDRPDYEANLQKFCEEFNNLDLEIFEWNIPIILDQLIGKRWPSISCGFETAMLDYLNGGRGIVFENDFTTRNTPIAINGLVWMGDRDFMNQQIKEKISAGYTTLKLKVGALDFAQECEVLANIRAQYDRSKITLRVDANGAFKADDVHEKLKKLATFDLHSIEQPIEANQHELMADLCKNAAVAVALDEELIGEYNYSQKLTLLKKLSPPYIVLKPMLLGGFRQTQEWIETAQRLNIGWWVTSALESNIGLRAIAQFTAQFNNPLPQGLGTGQLYDNNFESPLRIENGFLRYEP